MIKKEKDRSGSHEDPHVHVHLYQDDVLLQDGETRVQQDVFDGGSTDDYSFQLPNNGGWIEIRVMK